MWGETVSLAEGFWRMPYEAVEAICASDQRRGRWLGATTAMCPEGVPSKLLLFLDGAHHRAVRSALAMHLLGPAVYGPRVKELPRVLAPLLPAKRDLSSFVDASTGVVDQALCARLVARCLWFLCFGEAGLLDGAELDTVAAWNTVPKLLFLPRFVDRFLFGLLSKKAASARRDVLAVLESKGLDATFVSMNESLPAEFRRTSVVELADEIMVALNFAGVNGTTHLLVSTLAHLVGHVSDIPADSLAFPPTPHLVGLFKSDADAFIIESCRVDPPVTSACATFTEPQSVSLGVGCGGRTTHVKQGTPLQYVFGGIGGPNRDAAVFSTPNTFDPKRKELYKLLSWNGSLEQPDKYPRFCPGQQLSLIIIRAILGSIDELRDANFGGA
jgi:cytochrome P450